MRYFYWENAALPVVVAGQRYTFEVVSRVAGAVAGVLAIADPVAAEQMKVHGAAQGISEINQAAYEEHQSKKKSRPPGLVRPNSDPWFQRQEASAQKSPVAEVEATASAKGQVPSAKAAAHQATALLGKGGAQTVQPTPDGGHEGSPEQQLPNAEDLFEPARVGDSSNESDGAKDKPKGNRGRGRKAE